MTRDHDRILDYTRAFAREYDDMARERARDRESERSTRKRTANQTSQTRETQTNAVKRPKVTTLKRYHANSLAHLNPNTSQVEPSLRSTTRQLEDGEIASEKSTKPETSRNEQQTPTMPFEPARSCTFCGQKHWTSLCNEYPTIVQRLRRVYALKKCEKCLAPEDHSQEDCRKSHPCFYCRKANRVKEMNEHHTALCEFTFK
ncbi:unnamed protein product [Heligmosomoides polygyrus]|uniref:TRAF-type domain-containing protein n=1 Tax=Heligmosomoides polygyrus TaxID=6339 RepID=A0A183FL97_HELPZ|nr:unnamed protein product [Heligmosomoides polygyrus]